MQSPMLLLSALLISARYFGRIDLSLDLIAIVKKKEMMNLKAWYCVFFSDYTGSLRYFK